MPARFSVRKDELIITRTIPSGALEIVTWASGHRFRMRYMGCTKREAVRQFREEFTKQFPNP